MENNKWYWEDSISVASEWKLKHFLKNICQDLVKTSEDKTFFLDVKHPCFDWERGLRILNSPGEGLLFLRRREKLQTNYVLSINISVRQ